MLNINIEENEIPFNIRYIGDNYIDSNWEKDILNRRISHKLKNNITIYIPNNIDELYLLIYHIIIQNTNLANSKYIFIVQKLLQQLGKIC